MGTENGRILLVFCIEEHVHCLTSPEMLYVNSYHLNCEMKASHSYPLLANSQLIFG